MKPLTGTSCRQRRDNLDHKFHFDRGAAAVEMALVMPLLILMVMGIIDFGRIFNGEIQLSQAAREGARVAALGFSTTIANPEVQDRTKAALNNPAFQGGTPIISVDVVTNTSGTFTTVRAGEACNPASAADAAANYGQVTITIPYTKILFGPSTLSQRAVMKCSG